MQTLLPSEFKRGMAVLVEGAPQIIEDFHLSGTAQTRHKLHVRLRHLKSGRITERVFAENERVPIAELEHRRVQFSYQQGDTLVFSDVETFDELELNASQIATKQGLLTADVECRALLLEGRLVDIVLPPQVTLRVTETAPPIRGGSDATWKPAKLETGLEIMVPLFIATGDLLRVDTQEKKYVGKQAG